MAVHTNNNTTYYINPAYLTFVENSGYGANLIQVSASSSCYIRVFIPGEISYDADGNYRRWKITAYNNTFPDNDASHIYVRLEKTGASALIVYAKTLYEISDDTYFYIKIGEVTATDGVSIREITYDTGRLESDQVKNEGTELNEMWELDKNSTPWLIKAKHWLSEFTVKGFLTFLTGFIFKKGEVEKPITDIKRSLDISSEGPFDDVSLPTVLCVRKMNDDIYLSKIKDDRTPHHIEISGGLTTTEVDSPDFAERVEKAGWAIKKNFEEYWKAEYDILLARVLADVKDLIVQNHAVFKKSLSSDEFISGFLSGKGWSIRLKEYLNSTGSTELRSVAEFDDVIVRGVLRVFEFVVSQMLGENDNRVFTAMLEVDHYDPETGKVWLDTRDGTFYNPFRKNDVVMVQQFNGMPSEENNYYITKQYELIIDEVGVGDLGLKEERLDWVTFKNFTSPMEGATFDLIQKGDTFVRVDNLTDPTRKGIIQIMTVGEDTPYMDILYGRKTDPDNALKGRFGNIQGVYNPLFGWLHDFGAYLANLYAVGEFRIAHTGEDMADVVEMVKGQFRTNYKQTTYDMSEEDNFFTNASMTNDCEFWTLSEEGTEFFMVDDELEFFNYEPYATEESFSGLSEHNGRDMLRLYKGYASQSNNLIRKPGKHKVHTGTIDNGDGTYTKEYEEEDDRLYLNIRVYVSIGGTFQCGFTDVNGDFINNDFLVERNFESQPDAYEIKVQGTWDGIGDFVIKSSGDMYIDILSLTVDALENFMITTSTSIEQDSEHISLLGKKVNGVEGSVTNLGIELNAAEERITLYVDKEIKGVNSSVAKLEIAVDEISAAVGKIQLDSDGNVINISKSGLVLTADYASMFSSEVSKQGIAKTASLNAYVEKTELGDLVSKIEISADQINLTGVVTYSMLNSSLQNTLDGKAKNEDLIEAEKALNNSIASLSGTISSMQTDLDKKASIESLNAKVSDINERLNLKVDTDLENAVVRGSTLILNGYINTDLIDVDKISIKKTTTEADSQGNTITLSNGIMTMNNSEGDVIAQIASYSHGSGLLLRNTSGSSLSLYPDDVDYNPSSGKRVLFNSSFGIELGVGSSIAGLALGRIQTFMSADADFCILSNGAVLPGPNQWKGKMIWVYSKVSATIHGNICNADGSTTESVTIKGMNVFISDGSAWYRGYCQ